MQIAHFTSETYGGAGIAAERLHRGLLERGVDSRFLFDKGDCFASSASRICTASNYLLRRNADLAHGVRNRLNKPGLDIFTSPCEPRRTPLTLFGRPPDVVNLHWVARWLDVPSFFRSLPPAMPVVWSLHDMNPFTGGCHLWTGCERFTSRCRDCPYLRVSWAWDASARYFRAKERAYRGRRLHIVGNSRWTTTQARRSHLLRNAASFETIPLGLDTEEYIALDKATARAALRLPPADCVLGFACADLSSTNKNLKALLEALQQLPDEKGLLLLVVGGGKPPPVPSRLRAIYLGAVGAARLQSVFYSALDVFVMPSRMETFGLAGLEAMACATPVIAYRTGGIPDFLEDGRTGLLAPDPGEAGGLTERLAWIKAHPNERRAMGLAARERVERHFTIQLMAERYTRLYERLLADGPSQNS